MPTENKSMVLGISEQLELSMPLTQYQCYLGILQVIEYEDKDAIPPTASPNAQPVVG